MKPNCADPAAGYRSNLAVLCQGCHLLNDAAEHLRLRAVTVRAKRAMEAYPRGRTCHEATTIQNRAEEPGQVNIRSQSKRSVIDRQDGQGPVSIPDR